LPSTRGVRPISAANTNAESHEVVSQRSFNLSRQFAAAPREVEINEPASARSHIATAGSPTRPAVMTLAKQYAELSSGFAGPAAAAWIWRSLQQGKAPSIREIQACQAFCSYDVDGDGQLSLSEFGQLLHDQNLAVDYDEAIQALEKVAGPGERGLQLESFLGLIEESVEEQQGYSGSEVLTLQAVFDAYDANSSGYLEAREYSALFSDLGLAPSSRQESQSLGDLIASCRPDSKPGPINFTQFLSLARRIDGDFDAETFFRLPCGSPFKQKHHNKKLCDMSLCH